LGVLFVLALVCSGEQLTGAIQELPLPLARLDRLDAVVGADLLVRLAATDRLHGDSGLELGAVRTALAQWWELRSGAIPRLKGERWELFVKPV